MAYQLRNSMDMRIRDSVSGIACESDSQSVTGALSYFLDVMQIFATRCEHGNSTCK